MPLTRDETRGSGLAVGDRPGQHLGRARARARPDRGPARTFAPGSSGTACRRPQGDVRRSRRRPRPRAADPLRRASSTPTARTTAASAPQRARARVRDAAGARARRTAAGASAPGPTSAKACRFGRRLRDRGAARRVPGRSAGRASAAAPASPCRCAFVDRSRNRTRRYCCTLCADRVAQAQYRARKREASRPGRQGRDARASEELGESLAGRRELVRVLVARSTSRSRAA